MPENLPQATGLLDDQAPKRASNRGQVIFWCHDENSHFVQAVSFGRFLANFADELEAGEWMTHPNYYGLLRPEDISEPNQ